MDTRKAVATHRRHEHERRQMSDRHVQGHMQMAERHHHERHQMHQDQEAEMMAAAPPPGMAPPGADPNAMAQPGVPPASAAGPVPGAPMAAPGNQAA